MSSPAAPIPLNTPSHLGAIFQAVYRSYSSDPVAQDALSWSLPTGATAYLLVAGVTATLYVTANGASFSRQFNLATDGASNRPTLGDFQAWLTAQLTELYPLTAASSSPYQTQVLADSPVAYWTLEDTGTTAVDATGNGHTGTLSGGITTGAGGIPTGGKSMTFDGSSGQIAVSTLTGFPTSGPYTLEAWINPTAARGSAILGYGTPHSTNAYQSLVLGPSDLEDWWGTVGRSAPTSSLVGSWHHVAATWDGATLRLYLDGLPLRSFTASGLNVPLSNFTIGNAPVGGEWWPGGLAHVALYGAALSQARIQAHHAAGTATQYASGSVGVLANAALSALTIPEGYWPAPTPIPRATGLNYLQMRVMALVFDLIAADNTNMLAQMNPATATGMWLDWIGNFYGLPRLSSGGITESDDTYQRRIAHTLAQPYENNAAIAALLATALGTPNLAVTDGTPFNVTVWLFTPAPQPQLVVQLVRTFAPAGTGIMGMLFTPNSSAPAARMGTARMGALRCGSGGNFTVLRG